LTSPRYKECKEKSMEIEKYFFLKEIIEEVEKQKFLKSI
jgi:hypothetical protein